MALVGALSLVLLLPATIGAPAALAGPCTTCEPVDPGPPPPPPAPPQPRYEVTQSPIAYFDYHLFVGDTEDNTGYDEAYLKIDGHKVWGAETVWANDVNAGPGNGYFQTYFTYTTGNPYIYISMFDEDFPDPDDKLGGHQVSFSAMGVGQVWEFSRAFDEDSAYYRLGFKVRRLS